MWSLGCDYYYLSKTRYSGKLSTVKEATEKSCCDGRWWAERKKKPVRDCQMHLTLLASRRDEDGLHSGIRHPVREGDVLRGGSAPGAGHIGHVGELQTQRYAVTRIILHIFRLGWFLELWMLSWNIFISHSLQCKIEPLFLSWAV